MTDIHAHILPGFDDGPRDLDQSLAMLHAAAAAGTTDIVATPHLNYEFSFDPPSIDQAVDQLRARAPAGIRIHPGCELHFTADRIEDAL
ncbi:MAG: exopolysaccharide biosynthesis protein, partial [Acidobacteriia bacterium]|nr:exopolysaccharide biosynthesis protein [Terriglobia bacterium]